ncbi:MAG: hypothetical protein KAI28_02590, partial [Sphingomonadales bacterium]|nr:hypothetical protein [Sphingomonadales bacterium]
MSRITFLVMCVVLLAFPLLNRALPVLGPDAFDRVSDVLLLPLAMLVLVLVRWHGVVSSFHPGAVLYLFMAWGAVGVLSSLNSDWQALALYRQAYAFLGVFFVLALSHVFRGPEWTVEKAFKWLSYGGLIYLAALWFFMF